MTIHAHSKTQPTKPSQQKRQALWTQIKRQKYLFLMSVPFIIWIAVFCYGPLYGWLMAFVKFQPHRGIFGSEFVGLHYFKQFFVSPDIWPILRNTVAMSLMHMVGENIFPLLLALLINELQSPRFKKGVQTLTYLPHFVSFVVVANIFLELLGTNGPVNEALVNLGLVDTSIKFWQEPKYFWVMATSLKIWKELGWGSIIYLAAISGIDQEMYEAASIDGCGRFRRIWYITVPSLLPTVMILWIVNMSGIFAAGFDASYLLSNSLTRDVAEVIETFTFRMGISMGQYSFTTAVSLLQTFVGFVLVYLTNTLAKKVTDYSLW